jgi:hypothetical protein
MLQQPLPALDDVEEVALPSGLPPVVDAHVHIFPDALFPAIWRWFDQHGWPIRYRLPAAEVVPFLLGRGVAHVLLLHYAHRPGVARGLNTWLAELCEALPGATGLATVYPGEEGAADILREGFALGLAGVKLHAHVQCFDMAGPEMRPVYETCAAHGKPLLMHVGREPKSPAYPCDPYELCDVVRLEAVLRAFPELKVCVPHLGADEFVAYRALLERHDNLWLDTTMVLADYLPVRAVPPLASWRLERVMFGTDFPNIPYAWDRELKRLLATELDPAQLAMVLGENAAALYGITL